MDPAKTSPTGPTPDSSSESETSPTNRAVFRFKHSMRTILLRRLLAFVAGLLVSAQTCLAAEPVRSGSKVQKRIVMIIGENEYSTWETLPEFARVELVPRGYQVSPVLASPKEGDSDFKNFEAIRDADLVVVSVRRRTPPKAMMRAVETTICRPFGTEEICLFPDETNIAILGIARPISSAVLSIPLAITNGRLSAQKEHFQFLYSAWHK